jgi:hypothetical protein
MKGTPLMVVARNLGLEISNTEAGQTALHPVYNARGRAASTQTVRM